MKHFSLIITISLILLGFLNSCLNDDNTIIGKFPTEPVNFEQVNSIYDDYNSASPYDLYNEFPLVFSSNRNSQGENFDLVNFIIQYFYIESNKTVYFDTLSYRIEYYDSLLNIANSSSNEFGPVFISDFINFKTILFYASDFKDNLDLYYVSKSEITPEIDDHSTYLSKVNTQYNEAYPTLNKSSEKLYFCSDSTGNYDIYYVSVTSPFYNWLQTEEIPVKNSADILNSSANDKCPYINGNLMVFTSDRAGGYGGFDLYYSICINGNWSTPVNFGPEINTEYDEYRPITIYTTRFENDLMIFSSNRPSGKGGFDLYYVGIPKMIL